MNYRHVKVTAHVSGALGLSPEGYGPQLDALVEWVMAGRMRSVMETSSDKRHDVNLLRPRGEPVDAPGKIPIPIVRKHVCGLPIPRCSWPIFRAETEYADHFTKHFPAGQSAELRRDQLIKIQTSGGPYKSYRLPVRSVLVDRVVWFATVSKPPGGGGSSPMSQLRKLLRRVRSLGKKSAHGRCLVTEWTVEQIEQDWSWFAESDAGPVLMRPLPAELTECESAVGCRRSYGACVAPYWQRDFWREIVEPC